MSVINEPLINSPNDHWQYLEQLVLQNKSYWPSINNVIRIPK